MNILENIVGKIIPSAFGKENAQGIPASLAARDTGMEAPSAGRATVNVEEILAAMAREKSEKLNWRSSIVDLLKLLDMDSSLAARKELARELNYDGNWDDTAAMNTWLHEQVMLNLAENGGKIPDEMKH
jgi:hypothetical protein